MLIHSSRIAPAPPPGIPPLRDISPAEDKFSGFVFKIHANLDPKHPGSHIVFSGLQRPFERNKYYHHVRNDKDMRFQQSLQFRGPPERCDRRSLSRRCGRFVRYRQLQNRRYAHRRRRFYFTGIPSFRRKYLKKWQNKDPMKTKQLEKGLLQHRRRNSPVIHPVRGTKEDHWLCRRTAV